jgi:hypothetical protein
MAFETLENTDLTGEVRVRINDLFATDAVSICELADDLIQNGPEGVAKAAQKQIYSAVGSTIQSFTQAAAKELEYSKTLQLEVGGFTTNINLKIDLGKQFLELMEGGKVITPEGIDPTKLKNVLSNLNPATLASGITDNFSKDKIRMLMGNIQDTAFAAKQNLTSSLAAFSNNGAANTKKMISLQGLCNAAAVGSLELGLKSAVARQLNTMIPDLSLGEIKVLTDILV